MAEVSAKTENGITTLTLSGRIDSSNASAVEEQIKKFDQGSTMTIDLQALEYISSAGLRIFLRLRKNHPDLKLVNANSDIYEILQMTGFTEMMTVEKAYRTISIEGCEEIGQGSNGKVYRIDPDTVVKVYRNPDSLDEIKHEREVARTALVHGIPTAISYDVVKVGDSYASMFELLNAKSFSKLLAAHPENLEEYVKMYVDLLKQIHETEVPEGQLPDMRKRALEWTIFLKDHIPEKQYNKLYSLVESVPKDNHLLHGDYHTKNLMLQNGEVILIDMDTLAVGHPIFEFASMYNAYLGFHEQDPNEVEGFLGFPYCLVKKFWKRTLELYYDTTDPAILKEKEDKARLMGYIRLLRRTIRRRSDSAEGQALIAHYKNEIADLAPKIDSLL